VSKAGHARLQDKDRRTSMNDLATMQKVKTPQDAFRQLCDNGFADTSILSSKLLRHCLERAAFAKLHEQNDIGRS